MNLNESMLASFYAVAVQFASQFFFLILKDCILHNVVNLSLCIFYVVVWKQCY